jgi:hypothetical protein
VSAEQLAGPQDTVSPAGVSLHPPSPSQTRAMQVVDVQE